MESETPSPKTLRFHREIQVSRFFVLQKNFSARIAVDARSPLRNIFRYGIANPFWKDREYLAAESKEMNGETDEVESNKITATFPEHKKDDEEAQDETPALPIGIRQMAAGLLSDTSESETEGCLDEVEDKIVHKYGLTAEMYSAIRAKAHHEKHRRNADPFVKHWIEQQEKLYRDWKKRDDPMNEHDPVNIVEEPGEKNDGTLEITKVTKLKVIQRYTREQIEEEMLKMDPEKREQWESWFFQYVHGKPKKRPISKSYYRRDTKKLDETDGRQTLIDYYKTEMNNLKDNLRAVGSRFERVMYELEAKDGKTQEQVKEGDPAPETHDETALQDTKSEVNSASDEETYQYGQDIEDVEGISSQNILLPPNLHKIEQLLETKIIFPEIDPDTVSLGKTLKEVEQNLLEAKCLKSYLTRIVYFFVYNSSHNADSVKKQYEHIIEGIKPATETTLGCNKGCLLIYENVNMAIVMVEGEEFEVLKHLSKLKTSVLYSDIVRGKFLYIHQFLVTMYFNKWVVRVESPPAGKIRYMTKSKKILYQTAASRAVKTSEMLHKLYRHLSREEKYLIDPRSIYTKSKYIILLPSPASFAFLFKYEILRDVKTYLEDLGRPSGFDSEDEQLFAFSEDVMYSNYVDTDENEDQGREKLSYAKNVVKGSNAEHRERIKKMNDLKLKDSDETLSWDTYDMDEIDATLVDSRIKGSEMADHPALKLSALMEAREARRDHGNSRKKSREGILDKRIRRVNSRASVSSQSR